MIPLASVPDRTFVALLKTAPDAMLCVATDGRAVLVYAQAERLFGSKPEELTGQPVEIAVPEAARAVHPGTGPGISLTRGTG